MLPKGSRLTEGKQRRKGDYCKVRNNVAVLHTRRCSIMEPIREEVTHMAERTPPRSLEDIRRPSDAAVEEAVRQGEQMIADCLKELKVKLLNGDGEMDTTRIKF